MTGTNASKDGRAERLAAQLRANLARRKQGRATAEAAAAEDQRASASDPSDVAAPAA